jgi:hypothetical protein
MKDLTAAVLITAAVALSAFAGWLALYAPPLSGGTGWAIVLLLIALALVLRARRIRPEGEANR